MTIKRIWGLTGGVASGKSSAARFFREAGIPVVDADEVARELSAPGGGAFASIVARFGTADRAELRRIVFADPAARAALEGILHPLIRSASQARLEALPGNVALYEAALLVEKGVPPGFEGLIVVEAPREERLRRLMARDAIDRTLAEKMIDAQASDAERRAAATHLLVNDAGEDTLRLRVTALAERLRGGAP